ncbi:MAG: Lrp/AsnC family transcriptional regulator [Promethearchaeota archaeon]
MKKMPRNSSGRIKSELDETDWRILNILRKDGRMSYRKVAEKIGKTEATVRRRVKRMQHELGVIDHFTVILDKRIDKKISATITIVPDLNARKAIVRKLIAMPEITDVWMLSRNCGIFCRVEVDSMEAVQELIDQQITRIPGIQNIETCFVMSELKSKYSSLPELEDEE